MAKIYLTKENRKAVETIITMLRKKNLTEENLKEARKQVGSLKSLLTQDDVRKTKSY